MSGGPVLTDLRTGERVPAPAVEVHVRVGADESCRVWVLVLGGPVRGLVTADGRALSVGSFPAADSMHARRLAGAIGDAAACEAGWAARVYSGGRLVWRHY